jgi:hypothetical protein
MTIELYSSAKGHERKGSERANVVRCNVCYDALYDHGSMISQGILISNVSRRGPMKRTWTIIGVADVPQSFKWYQSLLGLPETAPAHDYFGQILDSDGTVLLCLHKWGAHEHPSLTSPSYAKPGNGLLLFFRVDNFDIALPRARALVSRLEEEPHT